jgi:hypothetical protein
LSALRADHALIWEQEQRCTRELVVIIMLSD